jgi:hypothetical protein
VAGQTNQPFGAQRWRCVIRLELHIDCRLRG